MELHELAHQGETDAGAFVRASLAALHPVEALEDVRQLACRYAGARVLDGEIDEAVALRDAHRDSAFEGELEGVRQQVEDDLLPHLPVEKHRSADRLAAHQQAETGALDGRAEDARQARPCTRRRRSARRSFRAPGLDA
jgi:hypothetical protein